MLSCWPCLRTIGAEASASQRWASAPGIHSMDCWAVSSATSEACWGGGGMEGAEPDRVRLAQGQNQAGHGDRDESAA